MVWPSRSLILCARERLKEDCFCLNCHFCRCELDLRSEHEQQQYDKQWYAGFSIRVSLSPVITSASMDKERCVPVHSPFSLIWKRISHVDSIQAKAHAHSNKLPYSQYGGKLNFIL